MRKDLRIGLGIGGVLLLVLIVALVVRNNGNPKVAKNNTGPNAGPVDRPNTDGDSTPAEPVTPPVTPAPAEPTPPTKPPVDPVFGDPGTPATADARSPGGVSSNDWDAILSGKVDATAHSTTPPAPASSGRGGRTPSGASASLPPMAALDGARGGPPAPGPAGTTGRPPAPSDPLESGPRTGTRTSGTRSGGTTATPAGTTGQRTHVVQAGETFSKIARSVSKNPAYYLQIERANPNVNPSALKVGSTIILPLETAGDTREARTGTTGGARTATTGGASGQAAIDRTREYRVQSGDSLYHISIKLYGDPTKVDALYDLNKAMIGPDREHLKVGWVLKLPAAPTVASAR